MRKRQPDRTPGADRPAKPESSCAAEPAAAPAAGRREDAESRGDVAPGVPEVDERAGAVDDERSVAPLAPVIPFTGTDGAALPSRIRPSPTAPRDHYGER